MPSASAPDHADVAFRPPLLLAASLALGFVGRWLVQLPVLPERVAAAVGPVLTAASFALFGWAIVAMRRGGGSIPTHTPTEALVATGPYRFSRNPIYLSMWLLQISVGAWANSIWFWVLALGFIMLMNEGVITREERYLARKFGAPYGDYVRSVRRWL